VSAFSVPAPVAALLHRLRGTLLAFPWVDRVVLYGSFAKGNWREDSDIDLAVFLSCGTPCGLEQYVTLSRLCRSADYDVEIQVFSADELEQPCGIVEEVVAYGVDLAGLDLL